MVVAVFLEVVVKIITGLLGFSSSKILVALGSWSLSSPERSYPNSHSQRNSFACADNHHTTGHPRAILEEACQCLRCFRIFTVLSHQWEKKLHWHKPNVLVFSIKHRIGENGCQTSRTIERTKVKDTLVGTNVLTKTRVVFLGKTVILKSPIQLLTRRVATLHQVVKVYVKLELAVLVGDKNSVGSLILLVAGKFHICRGSHPCPIAKGTPSFAATNRSTSIFKLGITFSLFFVSDFITFYFWDLVNIVNENPNFRIFM